MSPETLEKLKALAELMKEIGFIGTARLDETIYLAIETEGGWIELDRVWTLDGDSLSKAIERLNREQNH